MEARPARVAPVLRARRALGGFTNTLGGQLSVALVRQFPLGFHRHALRPYATSTWLHLGTPVHEVAEYLGDEPRTVLAVYAHVWARANAARTTRIRRG